MTRPQPRRNAPGWLALAALAALMVMCTWPARLQPQALLSSFQQAWTRLQTPAHATHDPRTGTLRQAAIQGGFDAFSRATGTPLPVLATVTALTPAPPGPSQVVKCNVGGRRIYADSWTACPRGDGQLISLSR